MGVQSKLRTLRSLFARWKIFRGDEVMITEGKDKGQTGKILEVYRKKNRVLVEGRNLVKKHIKRTGEQPGGIITKEMPVHVSNVMVMDPVTGKPAKIGWKYLEDGTKVRVSRGYHASGAVIPRNPIIKERRKPLPTSEEGLHKVTTLNTTWAKSAGNDDTKQLLAEAMKSLILDESKRPRDDLPNMRLPGFNCLPDSISEETREELLKMRGLMEIPRTWWNDPDRPVPPVLMPSTEATANA